MCGFVGLDGGVRSQMRTRLHPQFPANRENNREFCIFGGRPRCFRAKKPQRCSHFSTNSLRELTGKISGIAGNSIQITGNSSPARYRSISRTLVSSRFGRDLFSPSICRWRANVVSSIWLRLGSSLLRTAWTNAAAISRAWSGARNDVLFEKALPFLRMTGHAISDETRKLPTTRHISPDRKKHAVEVRES
jgi:hypothetical protein